VFVCLATFRLTLELHDRSRLPAILRDIADRIDATAADRKVSGTLGEPVAPLASTSSGMTTRRGRT
jgi:hypothetical protein